MRMMQSSEHTPGARTHPAWPRFAPRFRSGASVLLIQAPAGTGREQFARSWAGNAALRVVQASTEARTEDGEMRLPVPQHDGGEERTALLLGASHVDWTQLAGVDWSSARTDDLLLTVEEIDALLVAEETVGDGRAGGPLVSSPPPGESPGESSPTGPREEHRRERAERMHRVAGGWLAPTLELLREPDAVDRAAATFMPLLTDWIAALDGGPRMAQASFLSEITDETLALFFETLDSGAADEEGDSGSTRDIPTVGEMVEAGLLRPTPDGAAMMPELVRLCLQRLVRLSDGRRHRRFRRAATQVEAEVRHLGTVLEEKRRAGDWTSISDVLLERWPDLFAGDGWSLRRLIARGPRWTATRLLPETQGADLELLRAIRPDRMVFSLPAAEPDDSTDRVVRRPRWASEASRRPGPRALAGGLVEMGRLRLSGRYEEAADAARRLLETLGRARARHRVRPLMIAVVEFQVGMTLHIAGDLSGAVRSYEAGAHWAETAGNAFQLADAAAKRALLAAQRGQTQEARDWLMRHDGVVADVRWGRRMVARAAELAQVIVALDELDLDRADRILAELPDVPDTDEVWPAHAYALAMRDVLSGRSEDAVHLVRRMRAERPYACRSAMADELLDTAGAVVGLYPWSEGRVVGDVDAPVRSWKALQFEALNRIVAGDAEAARTLLDEPMPAGLGARWRFLARHVRGMLGEGPCDDELRDLAARVRDGEAELMDVLVPYMNRALDRAGALELLTAEQRRRLARQRSFDWGTGVRPRLTQREEEVLKMLRLGRSRKEIAGLQMRSENTVKSQIRSLYRKLDAGTLEEALEAARRWRL